MSVVATEILKHLVLSVWSGVQLNLVVVVV